MDNVVFRWATGDGFDSMFNANLSISSLQRFYPQASYCLLYNGKNYESFLDDFMGMDDLIDFDNLTIMKQTTDHWPFNFSVIGGAWWKWAPINLSIKPIEIVLDTDILFINRPKSLEEWVGSNSSFFAATDKQAHDYYLGLGDFKRFKPACCRSGIINVGVVGLKGDRWRDMFVRCSDLNMNKLSSSRSYHINEQGAANFALNLVAKSTDFIVTTVPTHTFAWWCPDDFTTAEGTHFIAASKIEMSRFYSFFREAILTGDYWDCKEQYDYIRSCCFNEPDRDRYKDLCCRMPRAKKLPVSDWRLYFGI